MSSETSICNQALSWLGVSAILSIDDQTPVAIACKNNYSELRDATLESAAWTFAIKRYILTPTALPFVSGYAYKFLIPSDSLRVLECRNDDLRPNGPSLLDWRKEGSYIVADADKVFIKCVTRIIPVVDMSPLFRQALAARLAATLAPPFTESKGMADRMWNLYEQYMRDAVPTDASQGRSDRIISRSLTSSVR